MDNSMGQSPCVVTAYLGGACNGGGMLRSYHAMLCFSPDVQQDFSVPTLLPNDVYTGPYVSQQNECQCSSIFYNTICARTIQSSGSVNLAKVICMSSSIFSWDSWDFNCSTVYPGTYVIVCCTVSNNLIVQTASLWAFQLVQQCHNGRFRT